MNVPVGFDLDQFRKRLLADAMLEATAVYWLRRAHDLEKALPKPGDFQGTEPDTEHEQRIRTAAQACRNKAYLIRRS